MSHSTLRMEERERKQSFPSSSPRDMSQELAHLSFPLHPTVLNGHTSLQGTQALFWAVTPHLKAGGSLTFIEGDNGYQGSENTKAVIP